MKLITYFNRLDKFIGQYNSHPQVDLDAQNYKPLVTAAFSKCFEYNLFLQRARTPKNSFFYSPFLRGICEDLISLKYMVKYFVDDRDELCSIYLRLMLMESIQAQHNFFSKRNVMQAYVHVNNSAELIEQYKTAMKEIMANNNQRKEKIFPSVEHMAIDSGLKDLYEFLYHATSRTVHFSPNILLRMGWYKNDGPIVFSSHNFEKYYHEFNLFYASLLFVEFCRSFKDILGLKEDFLKEVSAIASEVRPFTHHPELVTFYELNQQPPDRFFRMIIRPLLEKKVKKRATKKKRKA